ncbi:Acyl-coenzyme A thioesterase 13 [Carex littledalei]|uniref:Acyl-coenzyme A thioesterase 13 n=1 Tax=Carex littledalei TaxID=544730 RepID=A0A833S0N2_9POAL|nr:Acyl-coenzyme A thioesterase 13 [Carex littledalei]
METDAKKWLESLSRMKPNFDRFSSVSLSGINVLSADHGRVVCSFCIPSYLTDAEGYWQPGAIVTLMDVVGVVAIMSIEDTMKVTVDLAISFFSQAKLHEEVEIEAHTVEQKGKLTMVVVHIRKKASQQLVAVGRQWMIFSSTRPFESKL